MQQGQQAVAVPNPYQPYNNYGGDSPNMAQPYNYGNNQPSPYQQSMPQYPTYSNYNPQDDQHVSVWGWIGIYCINLIPIIGTLVFLVLLFVWAFGDTPKKSLKNWARAMLIIVGVCIVLWVVLLSVTGLSISDLFSESYYNY